ncbi:MAG: DUF1223 domain-containing protein [Elusimicrobia bacterium]|nr:DUF1223 domain-containing protein [Elusimicrobiota bacterium]
MIPLLLAVVLAAPARAETFAVRSGPARAHLLELFSSEGCSSCPPADAWVAPLKREARLWKDFVPVVFHVDYWDYLGWKDRFADPSFTARQRAYAAAWGSRSTYTPGFVLDGEEWRDWGGAPPSAGPAAGILTAKESGGKIKVRFAPAADAGGYEVFVARLGFGLSSSVSAGENAGRVLPHEFVVRAMMRARMKKIAGAWTAELSAPVTPRQPGGTSGMAVWVTDDRGRPIQAAGGFIPQTAEKPVTGI